MVQGLWFVWASALASTAQSQNLRTSSHAAQCSLSHDTDYLGNDTANAPATSPAECCALCQARPDCDVAVHLGAVCWMKSGGEPQPSAGRTAVRPGSPLPGPTPSPAPASSPVPSPGPGPTTAPCPVGPFQLRNFSFTRHTGVDRPYVIVVCGSAATTRLDPIITPGDCFHHMHSVVGSNRFGSRVALEDVTLAPYELANTTCSIPADGSIYWAPTLYYQRDGLFRTVPFYVKAYYLNRGNSHPLAKMPIGLRMIRGDPHRQTRLPKPDEITSDTENLFWYDTDTGSFPAFLDREWQVRIMFPNCWDGQNLVSSDFSQNTHVMFRDDASGLCPETHPVRIPQLFIEAVYEVDAVTREHPEVQRSDYLFGTGDKEGWGAHADYISGWHQEVLDAALETCDNNDWSNPRCAFHQFVNVRSKNPHAYYKGQPQEAVSDIEQLLVSGEECHMSGFPPATCELAQPSQKPAALRNEFGVFGTC